MEICGKEYRYELRWRLDYVNKVGHVGVWSRPSSKIGERAADQPRFGLVKAFIEAKDRVTGAKCFLAECDASDYAEHRWMAAIPTPLGVKSSVQIKPFIYGMTLVTNDSLIHCTIDGKIKKEKHNERTPIHAIV